MIMLLLVLLSIILIIVLTTKLSLHPFLALVIASLFFGICTGQHFEEIIVLINQGFGETIGKVGIIIIVGIMIGAFLEHSGGAFALANQILTWVGQKRLYAVMGVIGYIVSIPVFADSGFIILSTINRALSKEAKISLAGTAIALALGLTASHTMVPPTPGPITAAGLLEADLGLVILIGIYASIGGLIAAIFFASKYASRVWIDPEPEMSEEEVETKIKSAPSSIKSFLPILIPIILIVLRSIANYPSHPLGNGKAVEVLMVLGNPVTALLIGLLFSLLLPKKLNASMLGTDGWIGTALKSGAVIVLITGAGGAFGKVLQTSDFSGLLSGFTHAKHLGLLLPFLLATVLKTAQGSSTVALTTTAAIIAPIALSLGIETELQKAMAVIAIGAGSAFISHANDSFFWVVTQMSGMNVSQGYRLHSTGTIVLGVTAMLLLLLLNLFI
jgi:GntP family gluconate:H+ symporter